MDYYERELERLREAFKAGNKGALMEVFFLCSKTEWPNLPDWASKSILGALWEWLQTSKAADRGQHSHWLKKHRQDLVDELRAETVEHCRDIMGVQNLEDAYAAASLMLEGTSAEGKEDAIKKSWQRYSKRRNSAFYTALRTIRLEKPMRSCAPEVWEAIERIRLRTPIL